MEETYVLAYDLGTTGVKTCLFAITDRIRMKTHASRGYGLYVLDNGGVEQKADEWWEAMCETTRDIFSSTDVQPSQVKGISFCSQMQALILVDKDGVPVHNPMSYMDQRAGEELKKGIANGIQIAGANILKLIPSLRITGAVSSSVKDPLWKYKWLTAHEPEAASRAAAWLDVKEYIISRCTGRFVMTPDSAYSTLLYDTRKGHEGWSDELCRMFGVKRELLPEIIPCTACAGPLTEKAASGLGLVAGTPVFGGGGDATLIGVGSGCVKTGQTHIYSGTSGWVSTIVDHQMVDARYMIAAIVGAQEGKYNYFAEMETAGKCLEWVKDHLCLDEIGIFIEKKKITDRTEKAYTSLYDYMTEVIDSVPAGANGVIFTPWLHGNRCPFEDPNAAGMFFNIRLETGKTEMIRAVLEGVCYHLKWMLECQDRKIQTSKTIRFSGGGALSDVTSQMMADVLDRTIEVVDEPQDVGAVGAAALAGVGLGLIPDLEDVASYIPAAKTFTPDHSTQEAYMHNYRVFRELHDANRKLFAEINGRR